MLSHKRPVRTVHLAESEVMGRSAIAVVVGLLQPPALLQLTRRSAASQNIDQLGIPHLADLWAGTMVLAAVLMLGSYLIHQDADTRVLEMATCGLIAVVAIVHVCAIIAAIGYSGTAYTSSLDLSLIVNCGGRAIFLGRQIWWVSHRRRE